MAREIRPPLGKGGRRAFGPWPLVLGGLVVTFLGVALSRFTGPFPRLLCLGGGLFLCGMAVCRRLRSAGWDFEQRLESAGVLALGGLTALLAYFGLDKDWDSGLLFLGALTLVSLVGSVLLLLPGAGRRFAISLLVLFHFGGIIVAVTSVAPPGGQGPWLAKQLAARVYNPYLSFLYLTNAYHFYSPEPGAPSQLRFAIHYSDKMVQWVTLPDRASSPVGMHYQRLLALPEHIFIPMDRLPFTKDELRNLLPSQVNLWSETWEEIQDRRVRGSKLPYSPRIPVVLDMPPAFQYREPTDLSKRLIASCARRAFWAAPQRPGAEVTSVKVYRVTHTILSPSELANGVSPLHPAKFLPYFLGEFDGHGRLEGPHEPFLYWYLPILYVSEDYPAGYPRPQPAVVGVYAQAQEPRSGRWLDCMEVHGGSTLVSGKKEAGKR